MDYAACHVVFLNKSFSQDRQIGTSENDLEEVTTELESHGDLKTLLSVFKTVHVCRTGVACLNKIRELESIATTCTPTLVLVDAGLEPKDDSVSQANESESSREAASQEADKPRQDSGASGDFSGLALIKHLTADVSRHNLSKLAIPIAVIPNQKAETTTEPLPRTSETQEIPAVTLSSHDNESSSELVMRCVQAGAADVLVGRFSSTRLQALSVHAYKAYLEGIKEQPTFLEQRRMRKRSWVGVDEERPYAYLRESMVSTLMESICKPHSAIGTVSSASTYSIRPEREQAITEAITSWSFSAHSFSDDELLHAAYLMLQHALSMQELEKWRIPSEDLRKFLLASRSAYNSFVLYHNFRHVVDVLQAIFFFLLQIGTLPRHPASKTDPSIIQRKSPIAALLTPFDAFVLLISAIGHDVGHPGVNNAFLVALKAPLAQLYNDNSVLEAFHCAAYSQILRRYWTVAFEDTTVRKLLIKSILATDMQMHFKYMADLGNLQEKLAHNGGTDGWSVQQLEEYKVLTCGLLIKCADISNVARPFEIAAKWADILQQEFSRQGEMERNVGIPTTLFGGPPELGNLEKLGQSQIGFMNVFAYPLFESVADILPGMIFGINEIKSNQAIWKQKIELEKARTDAEVEFDKSEGLRSPRSGSPERMFAASPEMSHPEGIPASGSSPKSPESLPMSTSQGTPDIGTPQISPSSSGNVGQAISTPDVLSGGANRKASFGLPTIPTEPFNADGTPSMAGIGFSGSNVTNVSKTSSNKSIPSQLQLGASAATSTSGLSLGRENVPPSHSSTPNPPCTPGNGGGGGGSRGGGDTSSLNRRSNPDTPSSPPVMSANFSRPISMRHSANHSYARSSAPSNAPTLPSTIVPTSPAETQATSFLTEGSDIAPESVDLDRPGSGNSSALATSTASSSGRSPGRTIKTEAPSNGFSSTGMTTINGHVENQRPLRKKGSRFKFDFWKKKRVTESVSP